MLKKLNLDQTKTYEICIATYKISEMLVAFIQGRKHFLKIGSEQGDIQTWDDLVVEHEDGLFEHIQVKRQNIDFSSDPCIRDYVHSGKPQQRLRDLSPMDKTLESLANWTISNDPQTSNPKRIFSIEVPNNTTFIKDSLQIIHLSNFCRNEITPSTTELSLSQLQTQSKHVQNIFDWLTTWCGFKDWKHILKALRSFKIKETGNEIDLEGHTETILNQCFIESAKVRKLIHSYINDNSSYTSAISPRPLFGELKKYCLPGLTTWTQYVKQGTIWNISGTNDTSHNSIELASTVVNAMWQANLSTQIKVNTSSSLDENLPVSILRLIVHLPNLATAHLNNSTTWKIQAKERVGGTIGLTNDDCQSLSIVDTSETFVYSDSRTLQLLSDSDLEAKTLKSCMDDHTWKCICDSLSIDISMMDATELRDAIEKRWLIWKSDLDADSNERLNLCSLMLHPVAEGKDINCSIRFGPKTVKLIAEGLVLLLIVSITLGDETTGWKSLSNSMSVDTKALIFWSGPSGQPRKVRKLAEQGIDALIGKESSKVLILSGVDNSISEINEESLAYDPGEDSNMASPHKPMLIVTNSLKLKKLIKSGSLSELQKYFIGEIQKGSN